MNFPWLPSIGDITGLITSLSDLIKSNKATKDLVLRELKLNIKAFQTAKKSEKIDYDSLLQLLDNSEIKKARTQNFKFNSLQRGKN